MPSRQAVESRSARRFHERHLETQVPHNDRGGGSRLDHRAAARARPRLPGAQRHGEHRHRWVRRHGRQQHAPPHVPEHRRDLRHRRRARGCAAEAHAGRRGKDAGRAAAAAAGDRHVEGAGGRERPPAPYRQRGGAAALHRRADPAAEAIPRLSRDAGQAEGHRCDRRRHTGSHARRDRAGGHGSEQARLRAEAALLVRRGGARAREESEGETHRRHADGQPGALERRLAHGLRIHSRRCHRRRARGPRVDESTARLSGRRGFRVRRPWRPPRARSGRCVSPRDASPR